jgi:hypothetical protein
MGEYPGIFISRAPLPKAEEEYRGKLFVGKRPTWMVPTNWQEGIPLDRIILASPGFIDKIGEILAQKEGLLPITLSGFSQTAETEMIAKMLGISYYGNADFAAWAGTKIGLAKFASECQVSTPMTIPIYDPDQLRNAAAELWDAGYDQLVVKVNHSTGGMGHLISSVKEVITGCKNGEAEEYLPKEFMSQEGAVVQGWIPDAISVSLATFVDFDGSYYFTGAQAHLLEGQTALGAIGAHPIDSKLLGPMLETGHKIATGYVKHNAWGPHTMGMLIPPSEVSEKLGFPVGVPICNDENTRPGASTISKAWILALREGKYGIGWVVSKIKVPFGTKIAQVIEALKEANLLIKKTGQNAQGIFVFNGAVLDSGYEDKFYAIAVSAKDDPYEAAEIMAKVKKLFNLLEAK